MAPSKDKILNDIESLGDEITNADIMEIMAYSSLEGACGFAKKYLTPKESAETGKHYSREEFYEIMKTLESDKKGWRKKKWVNEIT